jgi:hypothetical protein
MRKYLVNIIGTLLLSVSGLLIVNNILFTHSHILNGEVITHAHPFDSDKTPINDHQHNSFELISLNNFMHFVLSDVRIFSNPQEITIQSDLIINHSDVISCFIYNESNKSPPIL